MAFRDLSVYVGIANSYAKQVADGTIVASELTRCSARRHLANLVASENKQLPYVFDAEIAGKVCGFIERLPHVRGIWAQKRLPLTLEPWEIFIIANLYGWINPETGLRRFRRAYIEVPRKNGKSILLAAMAIYALVADGEEAPEVFALATSKEQAAIVWRTAQLMIRRAKSLQRHFGVEANRGTIWCSTNSGLFIPKPQDPGDGDNPHFVCVDEYHEHRSPRSYDAMYYGMGSRQQPLLVVITTAGHDQSSPCFLQRSYVVQTLQEVIQDESYFSIIYTLDEDDVVNPALWTSPALWSKANPNLGVSISEVNMAEAALEAQQNPSKRNGFLTKRMNVWCNVGTALFNMAEWQQCYSPELTLDSVKGRRAMIGLDLASRVDIAALVVMVYLEDDRLGVIPTFYLPQETVTSKSPTYAHHYLAWTLEGHLKLTPGNIIDFRIIRDDLRKLLDWFEVDAVAFDPWQSTQLSTELVEEGAPMIEVRQTVMNMSAPTKELQALMRAQRIVHDGNPVMSWMMSNVTGKIDAKDNIYPRKIMSSNSDAAKIDGPIALIMALNRHLLTATSKKTSIYAMGSLQGTDGENPSGSQPRRRTGMDRFF